MESMLRRFGLKKGEHRETEARQKLQKELFSFTKCVEHGFPNKASAIAYDPKFGLMAIGTKNGYLRVYGAPGVKFSAYHLDEVAVFQVFFFGQVNIITLCSDNTLHLWEFMTVDGLSSLKEMRQLPLDDRMKTVSAYCLTSDSEQLLLGAENGHIYTIDLKTFKLLDQVLYQENIIKNTPEDFKVNPGAVESIVQHPTQPEKLLIGYNRGLIVLWDSRQKKLVQVYNASQQLESLTFNQSGKEFLSSHGNGSYITWKTFETNKPKENATTPYGPFPCKSISKMVWKTTKSQELMMTFSGGMPRASYGDRHTVTVMQGNKHVVFDFTSKVIDFFVICSADESREAAKLDCDDPHSLFVLAEEEMVGIDLATEGWPTYRSPYIATLHTSAITCSAHVNNVPRSLWNKMVDVGRQQLTGYSNSEWPIQGGVNLQQDNISQDLLITGHEDGSLRFWDVSSTDVTLLYKLSTSEMFGSQPAHDDVCDNDQDEEWPPFRKVGTYDPFSDDPRLAIQKIVMCPLSDILLVGGTAGQVIVLQFEREEHHQEIRYAKLNFIGDRDHFVWKGHDALPARSGDIKFQPGFQPICVVQLYPPAACTALNLHSEWQLLAVGTAHGFGVVDYVQRRVANFRCTLNLTDLSGAGETPMSRRKSFKKSLRESFRRLRSRRSERHRKAASTRDDDTKMRPITSPRKAGQDSISPSRNRQSGVIDLDAPKPVERAVEARSPDDVTGSIVRTLYFADTFLVGGQTHTPTFWAGTNAGCVFLYKLTIPNHDRRDSEPVECQLAKEVHLRHHAPVISICVIDRNSLPLPAPLEVQHERAKSPDMVGGHSVVICSEEQMKVFALPSLIAREKYKLTANEGSKLRKVGYVNFRSRSDGSYMESDLVCLTNQGEVHVYNLPHLRRQLKSDCIRKDNIIGIISSVFTQNGEGFYLSSPSEFTRFSVSAHVVNRPMCVVRVSNNTKKSSSIGHHEGNKKSPQSKSAAKSKTSPVQNSVGADLPPEGIGYPQDGCNTTEHSIASPNDSLASGDITEDSVRVHISEEAVTPNSVSRKRVVPNSAFSNASTERTTVHSSTNSSRAQVSNSNRTANNNVRVDECSLDGVSCLSNDGSCENSDVMELEELRIVEEGDDVIETSRTVADTSANSYTASPFCTSSTDTSSHNIDCNILTEEYAVNNNSPNFSQYSNNVNYAGVHNQNGGMTSANSSDCSFHSCFDQNLSISVPLITITEAVGENVTDQVFD